MTEESGAYNFKIYPAGQLNDKSPISWCSSKITDIVQHVLAFVRNFHY